MGSEAQAPSEPAAALDEARRRFGDLARSHAHRAGSIPKTSTTAMLLISTALRKSKFQADIAAAIVANCESPEATFDPADLALTEAAFRRSVAALETMNLGALGCSALDQLAHQIADLRSELARYAPTPIPAVPDARPTLERAINAFDRFAEQHRGFGKRPGLFGLFADRALAPSIARMRESFATHVTDENPLGRVTSRDGIDGEITTGLAFGFQTMAVHGRDLLPEELTENPDLDQLCARLQTRIDAIAVNDTAPFAATLDRQLAALEVRIDQQRNVGLARSAEALDSASRSRSTPSINLGGLGY